MENQHVSAVAGPQDAALLAAALWPVRRRFSVEEYGRLTEVGMLVPDDRTELLDGEVVFQMPINSRHAGCVKGLNQAILPRLLGRAVVGVQDPVRLSAYSEPQPDISILRLRPSGYFEAHPEPSDVLAIIEVADSSLDLDRRVKIPLYAAAGIAEVWLVDLVNGAVEVYREPDERGFRSVERHGRGARLSLACFPDVSLPVDAILGPV